MSSPDDRKLAVHALIREHPEAAAQLLLDLLDARPPKSYAKKPVTVHLRRPDGFSACGRSRSHLSDNLEQVTCQWCERNLRPPHRPRVYRSPPPPATHLARRDGTSICGHSVENLCRDLNEVTCLRCQGLVTDANRLPSRREEEILDRLQAGETLEAIGAVIGVSRERVRQIANTLGVVPGELRLQANAEKRAIQRRDYEATHTRTCLVCRRTFLGPRNAVCCDNEDCKYITKSGRSYLFPERHEQHRLALAKSILRYPEKHTPYQINYAENVLNGTVVPRGRWVVPGSKIALALKRVGREDLIPGFPAQKPETLPYVCRATSLNGKPCTRGVVKEGDLCHIHAGATKHTF